MNNELFFGISLTASFLAGILALFAPCCITFLFPSYLGTIFRDGKKIMWYTVVFALGLSFILIPVALGVRFFIGFFDTYHSIIYYLGGLVLIFMGVMTIKPILHLPQFFSFNPKIDKNVNSASVFGLGLMSGLTSSCCAPVLFAAVTLTSLSPTLLQAALVSFSYVLGIVFPLFILSLFYKRITHVFTGEVRKNLYHVFQILGAVIFVFSGIAVLVLTYLNKIQMYQMESYGRGLRVLVFKMGKWFTNPFVDIIVFTIICALFYHLLKRSSKN